MRLFRLVIGQSLVAVGFVLTLVALVLIVKTGGGSPYMYIVWGLGLLIMMLGLKSLPKKKQCRESPFTGRLPGRTGVERLPYPRLWILEDRMALGGDQSRGVPACHACIPGGEDDR